MNQPLLWPLPYHRYHLHFVEMRMVVHAGDGKTIYNCEMQTTPNRNLPKRSRYYQGQIDINLINKGEDYSALKKTFIIFICTFDPFGEGRYVYTFKNRCEENPKLELKDDAIKVFLNTTGTLGKISDNLKELLEYIDSGTVPSTCKNQLVLDLDNAVISARENKEWRDAFMKLELLKRDSREDGLKEGREETRTHMIENMLDENIPVVQIAKIAETDEEEIEKIKKRYCNG